MTVAERMRRDGWYMRQLSKDFPAMSWRHRNLSGMIARITRDGRCAMVGNHGMVELVYSGAALGLIDLTQRCKAAARRLARKGLA